MCMQDLRIAMACGENTNIIFIAGAGGVADIPRNPNRIGLTITLSHNTIGEQILVNVGPDFPFSVFILNQTVPIIQLSLKEHGKWIQRGMLLTNNAANGAAVLWSEQILPTEYHNWKEFREGY